MSGAARIGAALLAIGVAVVPTPAGAGPARKKPRKPAREAPAEVSLPEADVLAALCKQGEKCRVLDTIPAGHDAAGHVLVVAGVEKLGGSKREKDDDEGGEPCVPAPYALLRLSPGKIASIEPIVTLRQESQCEYGMAGGGEEVTVENGVVTHSVQGGSAWAWARSTTWRLSPALEKLHTVSNGYWKNGPNAETLDTDHTTGLVHVEWTNQLCAADGVQGKTVSAVYTLIPRKARDDAAGFGDAAFPKKALQVDSTGAGGFVIHGKAGKAEDARFRVIAVSEEEIWVEVADDKVVDSAKSWVNEDHLELWTGGVVPSFSQPCVAIQGGPGADAADSPVARPKQWGVRLADAAVMTGAGTAESDAKPAAERREVDSPDWGRVVRFKIRFPAAPGSISVVYSDSDDGKKQKRLLSTSRLQKGDPLTLGRIAALGDAG